MWLDMTLIISIKQYIHARNGKLRDKVIEGEEIWKWTMRGFCDAFNNNAHAKRAEEI